MYDELLKELRETSEACSAACLDGVRLDGGLVASVIYKACEAIENLETIFVQQAGFFQAERLKFSEQREQWERVTRGIEAEVDDWQPVVDAVQDALNSADGRVTEHTLKRALKSNGLRVFVAREGT